MTEIDKIKELKFNPQNNSIQTHNSPEEEYQFFENGDLLQGDMFMVRGGKSDWTTNLTTEYNKLGIGNYTWTKLEDFNDAVIKSQDNLIDLLRLYEGGAEKDNYEAHMSYKPNPKSDITIYGFGLTQSSMEAIGGKYNAKTKTMSNAPKTQSDAYNQIVKYLNDVVLKETVNIISKETFDKTPESVRAALFDYHFKNGGTLMREESGLKTAIDDAIANGSAEKWAVVLKKLVWTKPAIKPFKNQKDNPGIYRRSLSRVILAAKGLKKDMSAADAAIIDKTVKEIYENAVKCSKNNENRGLTEIEATYRAYAENSSVSTVSQYDGHEKANENKYKVPSQMGLFSAANAIIPENAAQKNGVDPINLRKAVINEIIRLNNIQTDGIDANGYPKVRLLEQGEEITMPVSVKVNSKTIALQAPNGWDILSGQSQTPQIVNVDEDPEAGVYIVQEGDSWWSIARDVATNDYTDAQIKTLQQQIADYNNNVELKPGMKIKLPPENYTGDDEAILEEKAEESSEIETNLDKMFKDLQYTSSKIGKAANFEKLSFEYSLKKGDTVYKLALIYGIDYKTLLSDNNIKEKNASNLEVGTKIKINKIAYTSQKDETIEAIAKRLGISIDLLKSANNDITSVKKGDKIEVPGTIYTVQKKDTWAGIAKKYSVTEECLKAINGNKIEKNQKVFIPSSVMSYQQTNSTVSKSTLLDGIKADYSDIIKTRPYIVPRAGKNGQIISSRYEFKPTGKGDLDGKTIIINAGHGFKKDSKNDPGNLGIASSLLPSEWLVAYDNAIKLKDRLCKQGATVILTQGNEIPDHLASNSVHEIGKEVNDKEKTGKDYMFICIHTNSSKIPPKVNRAEIFYYDGYAKGERLAGIFENKLDNNQNNKNYSVSKKGRHNVLYAAKQYNMPGILWEIAFQNTKSGCKKLEDIALRNKEADLLTESVIEYFNTKPNEETRYTVKKGDNLGKIAEKYHTTVETMQKINGLKSTSIRVGQKLIVPNQGEGTKKTTQSSTTSAPKTSQSTKNNYTMHTVKKGETISSIAQKHGVTVDQIKRLNGLKSNKITVGQKLKIKKK